MPTRIATLSLQESVATNAIEQKNFSKEGVPLIKRRRGFAMQIRH